jgi:molybdopterin converting factor small subunit
MTVIVGLVVTLGMTLFAQTDKKIDTKIDEGKAVQMIEKLEALRQQSSEQYKEERTEQKQLNRLHYDAIQSLTQQIWILNQRLKIEETVSPTE